MKVFVYESKTNYGTMVHIVRAATRKDADILVKGQVWPDAYVDVLDLDEEGIIYVAEPTGG